MRYRKLGKTGMEVSEIGYGAWGIGGNQWKGGTDQESIYGIDLRNGELYLSGRTASPDFPVTSSAGQPTYGGGIWDNFLTILSVNRLSPTITSISRLVDGEITLSGQATPFSSVIIQASPGLTGSFAAIKSVTSDAKGVFEFADSDAANVGQRFYRAAYP